MLFSGLLVSFVFLNVLLGRTDFSNVIPVEPEIDVEQIAAFDKTITLPAGYVEKSAQTFTTKYEKGDSSLTVNKIYNPLDEPIDSLMASVLKLDLKETRVVLENVQPDEYATTTVYNQESIVGIYLAGAENYFINLSKSSLSEKDIKSLVSQLSVGSYANNTFDSSQLKPNDYRDMVDFVGYNSNAPILDMPDITDNPAVDDYIRSLAIERGYKARTEYTGSDLGEAEGFAIADAAAKDWNGLRGLASQSGLVLQITSAHRNIDTQRGLFTSRLNSAYQEAVSGGYTDGQILAGKADKSINKVLETTAPPGFSKHHSGFTLDITEEGVNIKNFDKTDSYQWLAEDNFARARQFGFIPSYPEDATNQGPNPEAWEYVWVGKSSL